MKLAALARVGTAWPDRVRLRAWYRALHAVPTRNVVLAAILVPLVPLAVAAGAGGRFGTAQGVLLVLTLGLATVTDLLWRRIFNWLVLAALGWTAAVQLVAPGTTWAGLPSAADSLTGAAVCFGLMLLLYLAFRGGEGDVKLFAAIGALVGPWHGVEALMFGYPLAAVAALFVLGGRAFVRDERKPRTLPMAPFFAAGTLLTLLLPGGLAVVG